MNDGVGRLLVSCTDRPGIVAALSQFLRDRAANILQSDQHTTDPEGGALFKRTAFKLDGLEDEADAFEAAFAAEVAEPLGMDWRMHYASRAHERGVKIIGATAQYVTEELDAGPIIEQDVARVTHLEGVESLVRTGADLERIVLLRAVRWHLEDRVLLHGNRTVVLL